MSKSDLSDEDRKRIADNREKALRIQAERRLQQQQQNQPTPAPPPPPPRVVLVAPPPTDVVRATAVAIPRPAPPIVRPSAPLASIYDTVPMPVPRSAPSIGGDGATATAAPAPAKEGSGGLTAEQERIRAQNREKALARKAAAEAAGGSSVTASLLFSNGQTYHSTVPGPSKVPSAGTNSTTLAPVFIKPLPPTTPPTVRALMPKSVVTASYAISGPDRFKCTFSPYNYALVTAFKTVPSRQYDETTRTWTFALDDISRLTKALSEVTEVTVAVVPIPDNVIRILRAGETKKRKIRSANETIVDEADIEYGNSTGDGTDLKNIDGPLLRILFPYQRKGVHFGLEKNGRLLIADEMGLGKSVQAIAIARFYRMEWPLVIVCPSSVKSAWRTQFNRFLPGIQRILMLAKEKDPLPHERTSNTVIIMSYDLMAKRRKELVDAEYRVFIFDESHYLKDLKAQRTKAATELAKRAAHVILLSGTPALSRPAELFTQIRIIDSTIFPNFKEFGVRYCDGMDSKYGFQAKGATNSEELSAIMHKRFMIRRLKADVLKDLPEKFRELMYLSSDEIETGMRAYSDASKAFAAANYKEFNPNDQGVLEYYTQTGNVKAGPVCKYIINNFFYDGAQERKVLVFAHHQIVLDTICMELSNAGIKHIRIDGQTPSEKRGSLCDQFQEDPVVRVAVLSITAAGQGITLTAASVVIFAEIYWIPGIMLQAEDRAHRVGQNDSVYVQYMLARGTADDIIWPMVQDKLKVLGMVNLNSENFSNANHKHLDHGDGAAVEEDNDEEFGDMDTSGNWGGGGGGGGGKARKGGGRDAEWGVASKKRRK